MYHVRVHFAQKVLETLRLLALKLKAEKENRIYRMSSRDASGFDKSHRTADSQAIRV